MSPCEPQAGKQQEEQEIEIELPRPGQPSDIAEEDREQVSAMTKTDNCRKCGDGCKGGNQEDAKGSHRFIHSDRSNAA